MSTVSASNAAAARVHARRRPTMSSSARSTFESMVFHSSTLVQAATTTQTAGQIYASVENIHPTGVATHSVGDSCHERLYKKLFTPEHLFEVAVMYLFNGVKPTHTPKGQEAKPGMMEVLHYLAYIVPEADKLHVTDLNGHPEHGDRMEHVRVIFDPLDFRFRVIVKKTGSAGWVDISLALRNTFIRQCTDNAKHLPLSGLWVELVSTLRGSLVVQLAFHTGCSEPRVSKWLTAPEDIMWEVPNYGAGLTGVRDLFQDMEDKRSEHHAAVHADGNDEPRQEETPFIVSYWADNYLQMDSYKVARMFNGLVGYGEFLYDRGNNYTKAHVNNFFIGSSAATVDEKPVRDTFRSNVTAWAARRTFQFAVSATELLRNEVEEARKAYNALFQKTGKETAESSAMFRSLKESESKHAKAYDKREAARQAYHDAKVAAGEANPSSGVPDPAEKTWLWADMPYGDPHGPVGAAADTDPGPGEAVASLMQRTRVLEAFLEGDKLHLTKGFRVMVARRHHSTMQALQGELVQALAAQHGAGDTGPRSYAALWEAVNVFVGELDPFRMNDQTPSDASQGHLSKDILNTTCDDLQGMLQKHLRDQGKANGSVIASMRKMLAAKIHIARETWLLDTYTCEMSGPQLEAIQETYYTGFWDRMYSTQESASQTLAADSVHEKKLVGMKNNSSLRSAYMDKALSTYEVGYARAARQVGLVCDRFWCRLSPSVLQGYYDRKITYSQTDFIGHVDLTSVLRSSNSLVRTFDCLMRSMQKDSDGTLQTTRTMFAAQGEYFVLQSNTDVYSDLGGTDGGRRPVHADDLVTFSFALCTMVDNPGIWNLLGSPRVGAERGFYPKVTNNGFVVKGYPIHDSRTRVNGTFNDVDVSWERVADMTARKLQVGIMVLPDNRNKARAYLHNIINNTRHTSSSSVQHSFESFMRGIYNSDAYLASLENAAGGSNNASLMHDELVKQGNNFVGRLCACCWDANMQVSEPEGKNYAFSALHKLKVKLPTNPDAEVTASSPDVRYKCLFYILFGETIARWMADVGSMQPVTSHEQQKVQEQTHVSVSAAYQNQLKAFLETLTERFFSGDLHNALNTTLWARFPGEQATSNAHAGPLYPPMADPVFADLAVDMTATVMRTRKILNLEEHPVTSSTWQKLAPSAKAVRTEVQALLLRVPALHAEMEEEKALTTYKAERPLAPVPEETAKASAPSFTELQALDMQLAKDTTETEKENRRHAREVFSPYLAVYRQVVAFRTLSEVNKPAADVWRAPEAALRGHYKLDKKTGHFFENRMLAMAVCEEQMHLIQRHYTVEPDFGGNVAWCLLFSMFLYHRQALAELY